MNTSCSGSLDGIIYSIIVFLFLCTFARSPARPLSAARSPDRLLAHRPGRNKEQSQRQGATQVVKDQSPKPKYTKPKAQRYLDPTSILLKT